MGARTGEQFLERLRRRSRELWLGYERIDDVTGTRPSPAGRRPSPRCSTGSTSTPTTA